MRILPVRALSFAALLVASAVVPAAPPKDTVGQPAAHDVRTLAKEIDDYIARRWAETKVEPAPLADDAEFMRRVYLDVSGRIPSVAEARAFLEDERPDRRVRLVERLLAGSRYVNHFTNVWRALLIPEANNNFLVRLQQGGFEAWLKKRVKGNAGYDVIARDLLAASVGAGGPAAFAVGLGGRPSPVAFYSAKEFRPENLAGGTARVFLGVSVECAQCHNHPFAEWKRDQFWSFAAFYSGIRSQRTMDVLIPAKEESTQKELTIPGTDKVVQATFLDGKKPNWKPNQATRAALAEWVTSPSNPYFARAAANRLWAHFFGTGLVEPVDEMIGEASAASHPKLLDLLAREFVAHEFDSTFLIRAITASRTYQLTSTATSDGQDDPTLFARGRLRGLTPEQLFDSVALATGYRDRANTGNELITGILGGNPSARSAFLTTFHSSDRAAEAQTSIPQALSLMNGKVVANATSLTRSETLAAVVGAPFVSTATRIETLYLATLSRLPSEKELGRVTGFVNRAIDRANPGSDPQARQQAYGDAMADVFWALLNSSEFALNH